MENRFKFWLPAFATYILILFRFGYTFGDGDQSEMLPYLKYLKNSTLYSSDFYIQSIATYVPNERWVFAKLLSLLPFDTEGGLAYWVFGLHAAATFLLIAGLYRLASAWIPTESGRFIAVLAPLFLFYNAVTGGNELYYNTLIPSYLAQVLGVWAFYYLMLFELLPLFVILIVATFLHPLIGLQIWLLIPVALIFGKFAFKDFLLTNRGIVVYTLSYVLVIGTYLYAILANSTEAAGNVPFLDILEFRASHHYFPEYYPLKSILLTTFFALSGFLIGRIMLKVHILTIVVGCIVYMVGLWYFKSPLIASAQWFATTVWLKMFGLMLLTAFILMSFFANLFDISKLDKWFFNILYASAIFAAFLIPPQYRLFKSKNYDLPFFATTSLAVDIAQKVQENTPQEAVFLIPPDCSAFRFWSERSVWIDFKAINHRQAAFSEWYERIRKLYKIDLSDRRAGVDLVKKATENFEKISQNDLIEWHKKEKITHILTKKTVIYNFPKVAENADYVVYKIVGD